MPLLQASMTFKGRGRSELRRSVDSARAKTKRKAFEAKGIIDEAKRGTLRAFDWYLDRLLTPTGRLNQHILADHLPLTLTLAKITTLSHPEALPAPSPDDGAAQPPTIAMCRPQSGCYTCPS